MTIEKELDIGLEPWYNRVKGTHVRARKKKMPSEKKKTGATGGKKHASNRRSSNGSHVKRQRKNKKKGRAEKHGIFLVVDPRVLEKEAEEVERRISLGVHPKAAVRGVLSRRA